MPKNVSIKPVEELSYEEAMAELEKIVSTLESDQKSLDQAMQSFERGQALAVRCNELLEAAQLKIQKLTDGMLSPYSEEEE
ncbi:MAG: exodeoxyribonuclease VII small subunit [Chloroflexi bacterium RBG_16_51_16]|nr:MAG: exodeoxyribonuclease VII small subunit [Chloroflexi bacterium RBG_16_51_16]